MKQLKYLLFFLLPLIVIALLVHFEFINVLVDLWWFKALGYQFYFWQRLINRYLLFFLVTLLFFSIFFFNFWLASRYLGTATPPEIQRKSLRYKIYKGFQQDSFWVFTGFSLLFAILIGIPIFQQWETFLLYLARTKTGLVDPLFHKDLSYYFFAYPVYTVLQNHLLAAFGWLLVCLSFLYWFEHRLLAHEDQALPAAPRWHMSFIVLMTFLIELWDYILERQGLLYNNNNLPLFTGPGFTEVNLHLPLIWLTLLSLVTLALAFIYFIHRHKGLVAIFTSLALFLLFAGLRHLEAPHTLVDEYIVKPNGYVRQEKYLQHNINATLIAYKLNNIEVRDFTNGNSLAHVSNAQVQDTLRNVPLWDPELLRRVYEQRQELRSYYDFSPINVNRYTIDGKKHQSFLAARELTFEKLADNASAWVNKHFFYTHGYGLVMTPAARDLDDLNTWYLEGIPLQSRLPFTIAEPRLYFGLSPAYEQYAIAPNQTEEFDYPAGDSNTLCNYAGNDGIPAHNLLKRLLLAYYFRDKNLLFTTKTIPASKVLFRRNVVERIRTLTPFLQLDAEPYLAVTTKGVYWIQDAYTSSDYFPYAAEENFHGKTINYLRNAVKIVVDAYHGTVDYYVAEPQDPIIRAYERLYPSLFKKYTAMPAELRAQIRYPRDMFTAQMRIYAKYHQQDPRVFFQQEDLWDVAMFHRSVQTPAEPLKPYYITLDLMNPAQWDFMLLEPLTPFGKDNLRALALVGSDGANYGRIVVYNFPKGELIYGPSQIYALINQDPQVSELLTLWDQAGSRVERGRITVLPIGNTVIYVQPLYLVSTTALEIPQLQRVIMTSADVVEMGSSLEEAYTKLSEHLKFGDQPRKQTQRKGAQQSQPLLQP